MIIPQTEMKSKAPFKTKRYSFMISLSAEITFPMKTKYAVKNMTKNVMSIMERCQRF